MASSGSSNTSPVPTSSSSTVTSSGLSPELLAAIQQAVQHAVSARSAEIVGSSGSPAVHGLSLAPASGLVSSPSVLPAGGMSSSIVPSFVNTFSLPKSVASLAGGLAANPTGLSLPSVLSGSQSAVNSIVSPSVSPLLHKPFIIGPGYSPVPAKLVAQIVSGKFIDLNDLLPANLLPVSADTEPQLLLDGRLVLTNQPKKTRRRFEDIVSWIEAFSVYMLVLTTFHPQRWRDLQSYKLLIIRTYRQFSGKTRLAYDQAFREHAAATNCTDWSQMNVQLYNFHAAGSASRQSTVCRSWNRGHCSSPYSTCCYAHKCSKCAGEHKEIECSQSTAS